MTITAKRALLVGEVIIALVAIGWLLYPDESRLEPLLFVLVLILEIVRRQLPEPPPPKHDPDLPSIYRRPYAQIDHLRVDPYIGPKIRRYEHQNAEITTCCLSEIDLKLAEGYQYVKTNDDRPCHLIGTGNDEFALLVKW